MKGVLNEQTKNVGRTVFVHEPYSGKTFKGKVLRDDMKPPHITIIMINIGNEYQYILGNECQITYLDGIPY